MMKVIRDIRFGLVFCGGLLFPACVSALEGEKPAASDPSHEITPDQAAKIKYSTQRFVYLDIGESCEFRLKSGTKKRISLLSVKEYEDPVIHLTRRADVKIEIDGEPGCYIAALWVKDDRGAVDVDFCKVKVYSRPAPEDVVPTLFVTYYPSTEVYVDEPVNFRVWHQGMEVQDIRIDFGDGASLPDYRPYSAITHKFNKPGVNVVTVTGSARELPVTQKVKVIVQE